MRKQVGAIVLYALSIQAWACSNAIVTDDVGFCDSFRAAARCYCESSGLSVEMCHKVNTIYRRMIGLFGSLPRACAYQHYNSTQDCIDNWTCYLLGGIDSQGRSCNGTQQACPSV